MRLGPELRTVVSAVAAALALQLAPAGALAEDRCVSWSEARRDGLTEQFKLRPAAEIKASVESRYGGKVVSQCISVFIGKNEAEIDVSTREDYQGRGFAAICAAAFIDECISRGIEPRWTCWPFREGSIALAEKLGFVKQFEAPAWFWAEKM